MHITNYSIGFGVATVVGLCLVAPVSAAPVLTNTAALNAAAAADNTITEVRWIRRGWGRAAVATGVGLAVAGAVASAAAGSYAYAYPYGYGYPFYNYGYPSSYGHNSGFYGYAPYNYNYGYSGYGYNYGYTPGYYGYSVRPVARAVARRAYYHR